VILEVTKLVSQIQPTNYSSAQCGVWSIISHHNEAIILDYFFISSQIGILILKYNIQQVTLVRKLLCRCTGINKMNKLGHNRHILMLMMCLTGEDNIILNLLGIYTVHMYIYHTSFSGVGRFLMILCVDTQNKCLVILHWIKLGH
jgi:hypothetical protein